ncbi:hypothetical protein ACFQ16_07775 [Saccharopolyspora rosea]|uniref:Uncharacterized protein n=1 Tax=Saccharopolyspora rosea TaxID=524884 RepID=A0ABW3FNU7_9PSEU
MTSEIRREYHVARGYVAALGACLDHLDRMGLDPSFTRAARLRLRQTAPRRRRDRRS